MSCFLIGSEDSCILIGSEDSCILIGSEDSCILIGGGFGAKFEISSKLCSDWCLEKIGHNPSLPEKILVIVVDSKILCLHFPLNHGGIQNSEYL